MRLDADRFWSQVVKVEGCWFWHGRADQYGMYTDEYSRPHVAHRLAYMLTKGVIPAGYVIMHACDTPGCVNPEHLTAGTLAENMQDKVAKGRQFVSSPRPPRLQKQRRTPPRPKKPAEPPPESIEVRLQSTSMLTFRDIADVMHVTERNVYEWTQLGLLPVYRIGKLLWRIREVEFIEARPTLERFIEANKPAAAAGE